MNDIEGFNIGIRGKNSYVICSAKEKQIYAAESGCTEWVTVVECICADGTAINPLIIFKGENLQTVWIPPDIDNDWAWSCNSKGWTCDNIGRECIRCVFDPATRDKANDGK